MQHCATIVEVVGKKLSSFQVSLWNRWNRPTSKDFPRHQPGVAGMDSYAELLHRNPALKPMLECGCLAKPRELGWFGCTISDTFLRDHQFHIPTHAVLTPKPNWISLNFKVNPLFFDTFCTKILTVALFPAIWEFCNAKAARVEWPLCCLELKMKFYTFFPWPPKSHKPHQRGYIRSIAAQLKRGSVVGYDKVCISDGPRFCLVCWWFFFPSKMWIVNH